MALADKHNMSPPDCGIGNQETRNMKKLGDALQKASTVFDAPTPAVENTDPMLSPPDSKPHMDSGPTMPSPDLRPQNQCERERSQDQRQSGLIPTPFISSLALPGLTNSAIASTPQPELEIPTSLKRGSERDEGTRTPAAARPLLRRSTSDALRASPQRLRQLQNPSPATSDRPGTPGLISPTPVRRSRSSTYTTFCNDAREPQKDRSSTYLPHPSYEALTDSSSNAHSPSLLNRTRRDYPLRPPAPHRTPSYEVQQRELALRLELESLRGQLSDHELRREREVVAVSFALNRIVEQQTNQMHVQQMLLEKLAGMDLQATRGISLFENSEAYDGDGNVVRDEGWNRTASLPAIGTAERAEVVGDDDEDVNLTPLEISSGAKAEVDREWAARMHEG